jgi:hypothetical protein
MGRPRCVGELFGLEDDVAAIEKLCAEKLDMSASEIS